MAEKTADTRSLEFQEGTSNKFWTITLSGSAHTVRFGRKGTQGQEQRKQFDSPEAARASFDKLIAEKLKKGYHESEGSEPSAKPAAPATTPDGSPALRKALAALDAYLKETDPDTYRALKRGASEKDFMVLSKGAFGGGPVPPDLYEWFSWHNGQKDEGEILIDRTFILMPISEAVEICKAYRESKANWAESWDKDWVPVMENGGGDYLCYDPVYGNLSHFWHDATPEHPGPSGGFDNFIHLAEDALKLRQETAPGPPPLKFEWDLSKATPLSKVDYQMVFKAPQGTTYYGGPAGPDGKYFVAVNGPQQWVVKWAPGSLEAAFKAVKAQAELNDIKSSLGTNGVVYQVEDLVASGRAWTVMATITNA
jgi:predicted DNA-binding WGR domain protein/cell wall assembly regulator SMI1